MFRKLVAAGVAVCGLALSGCGGPATPSPDAMVEAMVDVFTSYPGFEKTGPNTFTQTFPLGLNKGLYTFTNPTSKGCRPPQGNEITCELSAGLGMQIVDERGNPDPARQAIVCMFGACPAYDGGEHVFEMTPQGKLRWLRAI